MVSPGENEGIGTPDIPSIDSIVSHANMILKMLTEHAFVPVSSACPRPSYRLSDILRHFLGPLPSLNTVKRIHTDKSDKKFVSAAFERILRYARPTPPHRKTAEGRDVTRRKLNRPRSPVLPPAPHPPPPTPHHIYRVTSIDTPIYMLAHRTCAMLHEGGYDNNRGDKYHIEIRSLHDHYNECFRYILRARFFALAAARVTELILTYGPERPLDPTDTTATGHDDHDLMCFGCPVTGGIKPKIELAYRALRTTSPETIRDSFELDQRAIFALSATVADAGQVYLAAIDLALKHSVNGGDDGRDRMTDRNGRGKGGDHGLPTVASKVLKASAKARAKAAAKAAVKAQNERRKQRESPPYQKELQEARSLLMCLLTETNALADEFEAIYESRRDLLRELQIPGACADEEWIFGTPMDPDPERVAREALGEDSFLFGGRWNKTETKGGDEHGDDDDDGGNGGGSGGASDGDGNGEKADDVGGDDRDNHEEEEEEEDEEAERWRSVGLPLELAKVALREARVHGAPGHAYQQCDHCQDAMDEGRIRPQPCLMNLLQTVFTGSPRTSHSSGSPELGSAPPMSGVTGLHLIAVECIYLEASWLFMDAVPPSRSRDKHAYAEPGDGTHAGTESDRNGTHDLTFGTSKTERSGSSRPPHPVHNAFDDYLERKTQRTEECLYYCAYRGVRGTPSELEEMLLLTPSISVQACPLHSPRFYHVGQIYRALFCPRRDLPPVYAIRDCVSHDPYVEDLRAHHIMQLAVGSLEYSLGQPARPHDEDARAFWLRGLPQIALTALFPWPIPPPQGQPTSDQMERYYGVSHRYPVSTSYESYVRQIVVEQTRMSTELASLFYLLGRLTCFYVPKLENAVSMVLAEDEMAQRRIRRAEWTQKKPPYFNSEQRCEVRRDGLDGLGLDRLENAVSMVLADDGAVDGDGDGDTGSWAFTTPTDAARRLEYWRRPFHRHLDTYLGKILNPKVTNPQAKMNPMRLIWTTYPYRPGFGYPGKRIVTLYQASSSTGTRAGTDAGKYYSFSWPSDSPEGQWTGHDMRYLMEVSQARGVYVFLNDSVAPAAWHRYVGCRKWPREPEAPVWEAQYPARMDGLALEKTFKMWNRGLSGLYTTTTTEHLHGGGHRGSGGVGGAGGRGEPTGGISHPTAVDVEESEEVAMEEAMMQEAILSSLAEKREETELSLESSAPAPDSLSPSPSPSPSPSRRSSPAPMRSYASMLAAFVESAKQAHHDRETYEQVRARLNPHPHPHAATQHPVTHTQLSTLYPLTSRVSSTSVKSCTLSGSSESSTWPWRPSATEGSGPDVARGTSCSGTPPPSTGTSPGRCAGPAGTERSW